VGLGFLLVAVALLLTPGSYHRIVAGGEDTEDLHGFTTAVLAWALLPFSIALGFDVYVATVKLGGGALGELFGVGTTLSALFFWYGIEALHLSRRGARKRGEVAMGEKSASSAAFGTPLRDKIRHVLTEARMVLPGAQALLGFQLAIVLLESFDQLTTAAKYLHLASLSCVLLSTILLMTPAAYHRLVERGEETEEFHRFASRMVIAAMALLAVGICGDLALVLRKVTGSTAWSAFAAGSMLALFYGLWFGLTLHYKRRTRDG
jgi:hypothetical protein